MTLFGYRGCLRSGIVTLNTLYRYLCDRMPIVGSRHVAAVAGPSPTTVATQAVITAKVKVCNVRIILQLVVYLLKRSRVMQC